MRKSSIALRVKELLLDQGFDRQQADALALVFDEIYHSQMEDVATKEDIKMLIEMIDKRFEAMDKRFEEQLHYMDKRFEELLHYVDKRFEDMNKRFEDLNKRITFTQWLIVLLFTAYTGIVTFVITYVLPHILT